MNHGTCIYPFTIILVTNIGKLYTYTCGQQQYKILYLLHILRISGYYTGFLLFFVSGWWCGMTCWASICWRWWIRCFLWWLTTTWNVILVTNSLSLFIPLCAKSFPLLADPFSFPFQPFLFLLGTFLSTREQCGCGLYTHAYMHTHTRAHAHNTHKSAFNKALKMFKIP